MSQTEQPGDSLAVWLFALGQTLGYACLYYSFGALLVDLEAGTGWSKAQLALGPTLGLVIAAAGAPLTGRLVDRGWGGELLVAMPLLGATGLALLATASTLGGWLACWALIGVAQSGSLYDTCFSFLTRRLGPGARKAIIRVTLVAGLASTLAFPLGAAVAHAAGWQGGLLAFAALLAGVAAPANLIATIRLRRKEAKGLTRPAPEPGALATAMRRPEFWMLAGAFALAWMNHMVLVTFAVPLFAERGADHAFAVTAAACIGPAQVAGRFVLMLNEARVGTFRATTLALSAMTLASGVLWLAGAATPLILAFAVLQGAGIGLMSILRPVLAAEVLGRRGFGAISGALAVAPLLAAAAAPALGAVLLTTGGAPLLIASCLAMAFAALILATLLRRRADMTSYF